jgi:hypothetical protein
MGRCSCDHNKAILYYIYMYIIMFIMCVVVVPVSFFHWNPRRAYTIKKKEKYNFGARSQIAEQREKII